jgi:predicted nucleic acid-binding protein
MQKTIISDTSCLILLEKIGELALLHQLFGTIITTPEVAAEFGSTLPIWFEIKSATDSHYQIYF